VPDRKTSTHSTMSKLSNISVTPGNKSMMLVKTRMH
jgi:hypothetical protein